MVDKIRPTDNILQKQLRRHLWLIEVSEDLKEYLDLLNKEDDITEAEVTKRFTGAVKCLNLTDDDRIKIAKMWAKNSTDGSI